MGKRFNQEQYDMLKRCSDKKDMTEWNNWRKANPSIDIQLSEACFEGFFLKKVNFIRANVCYKSGQDIVQEINYNGEVHLEKANFKSANLEGASFGNAILKKAVFWHANATNADFHGADLEDANLSVACLGKAHFNDANLMNARIVSSGLMGSGFTHANLCGTTIRVSIVDGATQFWEPKINKCSRHVQCTDMNGTSIEDIRIDPGTKQLLYYNIRRMNWEEWYKKHRVLKWPVRLFWAMSDYGISTWRVIVSFFLLAIVFALVYWVRPGFVMVNNVVGDIRGFVHALYFSVVTMTTLGFGDIAANPDSWGGQILLMVQVILGYVLLGALITRFAVLFTAGGPAGKFAKGDGKGQ